MKTKNLEILILIGIPGSGKSTFSKDFVRNNSDWIRVNRDDFRDMLKTSQTCENKVEDMITGLVSDVISSSLSRKLNVIVDNTNLKIKYINAIIEEFKYSANINYRVFDISKDKAIERDKTRDKKVGALVINKMYKDYKILIDSFDFQPVNKTYRPHLVPNFNSPLQQAVIFDIDGTLALMGKRNPYDWENTYKDELNIIVAEQLEFHRTKGRKIIIVTGRDSICRKVTEDWLDLYELEYDVLYMRKKDDFRKDTIIKREIYENEIKNNYNILAVYEDRISVSKQWNDIGLFVFNVNQYMQIF